MARIILGLCSSHSPQLNTAAETWPRHGENDKGNPWLYNKQGKLLTYDEALAAAEPRIGAEELTAEKHAARWGAIQKAVERLQQELLEAKPDVVVVFGDDQAEIFSDDFRPALMMYTGETVPNMPYLFSRAKYEAGRASGWAYGPELDTIQIKSDLADHIVHHLMLGGFDLGHTKRFDEGVGLGHAYGYVFGRIMNGHRVPMIPVIINTLYPPNQPTAWRCWDLGRAVREAILSWPEDIRVAVVGSGGLSHFLVDEELDRQFLTALKDKDAEWIKNIPYHRLQSGTGELRSWISAVSAFHELPLVYTEYQPCYRSPAGSGMGMGFGVWK